MEEERAIVTGEEAEQTATVALYEAFAAYPARPEMSACRCCTGAEAVARLLRAPLCEATGDDLEHYAFKALTTWGGISDLKHFIPRLLDLARNDALPVEHFVVAGKLGLARLCEWPEVERCAVEAFYLAWWESLLAQPPSPKGLSAFELLRDLVIAGLDAGLFLQAWEARDDVTGGLHLARFAVAAAGSLEKRGRLTGTLGALWCEHAGAQALVVAWLLDPRQRERLERAFFAACTPQAQSELSAGLQVIEHLVGLWGMGYQPLDGP